MADPIEQFNLDLERLLKQSPVSTTDPALKTASVLLALETEAEVRPPAGLRARWIAGTRSFTAQKSNSPVPFFRSRTFLSALTALVCLLVISGSVYALARSLGYIPGLGLVTKGSQVRVLAKPVSRTRDGVTITVKDAIWDAKSMLVVFEAQGLSPDKYSPLEPLNTCTATAEMRFSNADPVKMPTGVTEPLDGGFESRYQFEAIPAGAAGATLFIPCIEGATAPGILPENWELPLRFIAAPPDFAQTILPVNEPTDPSIPPAADTLEPAQALPSLQPLATSSLAPVETKPAATGSPLSIKQVIDAGDKYILIGSFDPPAPSQPGEWRSEYLDLDLTDASGQELDWQIPADFNPPASGTLQANAWAVEFSKEFVPPLNIRCEMRYTLKSAAQDTLTLDFDAGPDPQPGQEWVLNREFQYAGHTVRLVKISANLPTTGYSFYFDTMDPTVSALSVRLDGAPSTNHIFQLSGTDQHGKYRWVFYEFYAGSLPKGKWQIIPFDLYLKGETKSWSFDWQPER